MKNLQLYSYTSVSFPELKLVEFFCVDNLLGKVYVYSEGCVYNLQNGSLTQVLDLKKYYNVSENPKLVSLSFNAVLNAVCLALELGEVLTIDCDSKETQCVGCVESGLKAMEWSPDQEAVVLVTGLDTIIVMTGTFDPITEVDFHQDNFGENQFITVGWGKKETQFHGSEGKAARSVVNVDKGVVDTDDGKPRVSWRGDGSLFAASIVQPDTNCRRIRIFSREGILQYTSEPISGLEMTLAWRPSGNAIASTQLIHNKYQVIFFEKNGLRHGEFVLPFVSGEGRVCQLSWNIDSSVLALWYEYTSGKGSCLQLWTVNNYHWYLKQSIPFQTDQQIQSMQWDTEAGLRLHLISSDMRYSCFEWIWNINYSCVHSPDNAAYVAVIDGCFVNLSSFRNAVIPPPMYGERLELPGCVSQVVFGPASKPNCLCVVMNDSRVAVFNEEGKYVLVALGPVKWCCEPPESLASSPLHHWLWLSDNRLLCIHTSGQSSHLVVMDMDVEGFITAKMLVDVGDVVLSITSTSDASGAVIQVRNRNLLLFKNEHEALTKYQDQLPEAYLQTKICRVNDSDVVLGVSKLNRLYVNGREMANNVTSFFLHPDFLLLTTSQHTLQCLSLVTADLIAQRAGRRVECGARLVVAVGTRVVLQLPRGNLECITPRPMVLRMAASMLDRGEYHPVFELFRKQHINLNLLVDHNPMHFLEDLNNFVSKIQNPAWLALFLTELSNDDLTRTMYAESYDQEREKFVFQPSKVTVVCDRLREAMQARSNADHYLLPILTSYIQKRTEEDLAAALLKVKAAGNGAVSRDEALKYLLYMVDVNELYNIALGLYDFDLVLLVASKSNKDPKEYAPFLNELRRMEINYQHFCIDKYLKRYSSALNHIALCPDHFNECLELVTSHNLYLKALQLFPRKSDQYLQVASLYGNSLMNQKLYVEAAIMYKRSHQLVDALEACRLALDWREALLIMSQLDYSAGKVQEVCRELAATLVEQCRHLEAALLLSQHVGDIEESVAVLSQGHHWDEALRLVHLDNRLDLVETHVKPGIVEHLEQLQHQFKSSREQFLRYKSRLQIVRMMLHLEDNEPEHLREESDLYSDTSSFASSILNSSRSGSRSSGRTGRSSKNRRKQERKMLSLKEGNPYEDLALIRALHQLMTLCLSLRDEANNLCRVLLRFDLDTDAAILQHLLTDVLQIMENSKAEIWLPEMAILQTSVQSYGPYSTSNSIAADLQTNSGQENNLSLLEPHLRIPPVSSVHSNWKLQILSPFESPTSII